MTFVIVGGGPTGVELAGAIAELARQTLKNDFRNINPSDAKVIVVDGQDRMLANFVPELSHKAEVSLKRLGIEMRTGTHVTAIHPNSVDLSVGDQHSSIQTRTILWAAGVAGVPLGRTVAAATNVEADRGGRVPVGSDISIAGYPVIFEIGDLALCSHQTGKALPGVAQVAIQQGKNVGRAIANQLAGSGGRSGEIQLQRRVCVAYLVVRPHHVDRNVPKPCVSFLSMGVELFDLQSHGPANYGTEVSRQARRNLTSTGDGTRKRIRLTAESTCDH